MSKGNVSCLFSLVLLHAPAIPSFGSTLHVPSEYPTIQAALNATSVDDTVLVSSGTYFEKIVIPRRITLLSESGPDVTTIDAHGQGTVVIVDSSADGAIIEGFRITGGYAPGEVGGILVIFVSAVIRHNIIEDNHGASGGIIASSAKLENNIIRNRSVDPAWT